MKPSKTERYEQDDSLLLTIRPRRYRDWGIGVYLVFSRIDGEWVFNNLSCSGFPLMTKLEIKLFEGCWQRAATLIGGKDILHKALK